MKDKRKGDVILKHTEKKKEKVLKGLLKLSTFLVVRCSNR